MCIFDFLFNLCGERIMDKIDLICDELRKNDLVKLISISKPYRFTDSVQD